MDANVGDLVVCLESGIDSRAGRIYQVEVVVPAGETWDGFLFLNTCYKLHGLPEVRGALSAARRFRKIDHDKPESCETEFVTLLKRSRVSA